MIHRPKHEKALHPHQSDQTSLSGQREYVSVPERNGATTQSFPHRTTRLAAHLTSILNTSQKVVAYYLLAAITITQTYFILETVSPVSPPVALHVHIITWGLPLLLVAGALVLDRLWRRRMGIPEERSQIQEHIPMLLGLLLFVLWSAGYFLVGALTAGHHATLGFSLDHRIPYMPTMVFVYVTVYPFVLLPFAFEHDLNRAMRTTGAFLTVLIVAYVTMFVYPVALAHPKPAGPMFTRFTIGLLHGADPAWNCFPSSHCAMVMMSALVLWDQGKLRGTYGFLVALAIGISTLLTKQHYIMDVLAGFVLAFVVHWAFFRTAGAKVMADRLERKLTVLVHRLDWF